ncbi:hypothetical protein V5O48_013490 [Marasmius crinis-equi]|uniref:HAT C-terminal dimerisation domain-containing protein n=1 Tax=Marasmius crinis-equi TaxID=585013 RepID=A0ABR3F024_9AGAR
MASPSTPFQNAFQHSFPSTPNTNRRLNSDEQNTPTSNHQHPSNFYLHPQYNHPQYPYAYYGQISPNSYPHPPFPNPPVPSGQERPVLGTLGVLSVPNDNFVPYQTPPQSVSRANDPSSATSNKRPRTATKNVANKRRKTNAPSSIPQPAVPGVGPSQSASTAPLTSATPSTENLGSKIEEHRESRTKGATDVWFFFEGVNVLRVGWEGGTPPPPIDDNPESEKRPSPKQYQHLLCRLCDREDWSTYKNTDGQSSTLRDHLKREHLVVWKNTVKTRKLKGWETIDSTAPDESQSESEPFCKEGFYTRLIRFLAVYDEAINLVECPEFRELLEYVGGDKFDTVSIPHRNQVFDLIIEQFRKEYTKMIEEMKNSIGRVSFTSDVWSRQTLTGHMAVTGHWMAYDSRDQEREVLNDVRDVLYYPHAVQELVSAERTPTLPIVIPLYEDLLTMFRCLKEPDNHPKLSHAIDAAIHKLELYFEKARQTKVYTLAVAINPAYKFEYMQKNWTTEEVAHARECLRNAMLDFKRAERPKQPSAVIANVVNVSAPSPSHASRAQKSGMAHLKGLLRTLSKTSVTSSSSDTSSDSPAETTTSGQPPQMTEEELDRRDLVEVDKELLDWESETVEDDEDDGFDLLQYWDERRSKKTFPLIFKVAMDVLPAQASAVPCERVFSSAKDTDTDKRSRLSGEMFEKLQVLKHRYKEMRFLDTLLLDRDTMVEVVDLDTKVIDDMITQGRVQELHDIFAHSTRLEKLTNTTPHV